MLGREHVELRSVEVAKLVSLLLYVYLFGIFILALLSWINPGTYNPVASVIANLTEPLMRPVRRLIPPMGGLDLSALVVILGLYVVRMLIMPPLDSSRSSSSRASSPRWG